MIDPHDPKSLLKADLAPEVRALLAGVLGVTADDIEPGSELEADLAMDSLKMIETNVALETRFGFVTPDVARPEELNVHTFDDLVGYVADQILSARGDGR